MEITSDKNISQYFDYVFNILITFMSLLYSNVFLKTLFSRLSDIFILKLLNEILLIEFGVILILLEIFIRFDNVKEKLITH